MDRIKDSRILGLVEQISVQYQTNISNRFMRPLMLQMQIDKTTWDRIEMITEKFDMYRLQGFHLDELYTSITACTRFVDMARSNLVPNLKARINATSNIPDKILKDMAANNFPPNLQVFANLLNSLFVQLIEFDKNNANNKPPVYTQMPELSNISQVLVR